jgi:arsenate reductase
VSDLDDIVGVIRSGDRDQAATAAVVIEDDDQCLVFERRSEDEGCKSEEVSLVGDRVDIRSRCLVGLERGESLDGVESIETFVGEVLAGHGASRVSWVGPWGDGVILASGCGSRSGHVDRDDLRYRATVPRQLTVLHNPQCSKSREALGILADYGYSIDESLTVVEYLVDPPSAEAIRELIRTCADAPSSFVRPDPEVDTSAIDLEDTATVATLLAEHPSMLQRPIVTDGTTTIICRPAGRIQELLDG